MQAFRKLSYALLAASSALLVACGGGSSGSDTGVLKVVTASAADTSSSSGGQDVLVAGTATTTRYALSSMTWQVQAVTAGAPALVTTNGDCPTAVKSTQQGTNSGGQTYTTSNWQCSVDVKAPRLTADAQYQLILTAMDSNGTVDTHVTALTVKASQASGSPLTADAGSALSLTSGAQAQLQCLGSGGQLATGSAYTFQWVQVAGADAALTLSSNQTASPTFNAPAVASATTVTLQCRVTDDSGMTATASKAVTINPVQGNVLVVNTLTSSTVAPGQSVALDGSSSGWFNAGAAATGPQLYYQWTQTGGPTLSIANPNQARASITIPTNITASTVYTFHLDVADAPFGATAAHTASGDVSVTADPQGLLNLSLDLPSQSVASNVAVLMTAKASSLATSPVYYSWTQISGPSVAIGGALTAQAGFVGPTVSSPTTFVFRVTAGFQPITGGYAGVASQDEVVVITP